MYMGYVFSYEGVYICTWGTSSVTRGCMYTGCVFSYEGVYVHRVCLQL